MIGLKEAGCWREKVECEGGRRGWSGLVDEADEDEEKMDREHDMY